MSETQIERQTTEAQAEDYDTALFAQLVMQQSNMALMLMGKVAHPQTGQVVQDIDAAKLFIDQLEMLETKTKGNLNKEESALLKQSLMTLRLAFVEAVEAPAAPAPGQREKSSPPEAAQATAQEKPAIERGSGASDDEEHRKKFTKKY